MYLANAVHNSGDNTDVNSSVNISMIATKLALIHA